MAALPWRGLMEVRLVSSVAMPCLDGSARGHQVILQMSNSLARPGSSVLCGVLAEEIKSSLCIFDQNWFSFHSMS